jgi:hypothetical protein
MTKKNNTEIKPIEIVLDEDLSAAAEKELKKLNKVHEKFLNELSETNVEAYNNIMKTPEEKEQEERDKSLSLRRK